MSFALIGRVSLFFLPLAGFRFRPRFPFLPFSLPRLLSPISLVILSFSVSGASMVHLDEPTNQAVNGNEAKPKRMMVL